ncbi:hypothetical protein HDF24_03060 [Mucilaginibacter sp. X4EP1]
MRLRKIGKRHNISKEHACGLKEHALQKLRNCTHAPMLKSCFN